MTEPSWYPNASHEGRLADFHENPRDVSMPELIASLVPSRKVVLHETRGGLHDALVRNGDRFGLLAVSERLVRQLLEPCGNPSDKRRWEYLESARQLLYEATQWATAREHVRLLLTTPSHPMLSQCFHHRALLELRVAAGPGAFSTEEVVHLLESDEPKTRQLALIHLVPLIRMGPNDG